MGVQQHNALLAKAIVKHPLLVSHSITSSISSTVLYRVCVYCLLCCITPHTHPHSLTLPYMKIVNTNSKQENTTTKKLHVQYFVRVAIRIQAEFTRRIKKSKKRTSLLQQQVSGED